MIAYREKSFEWLGEGLQLSICPSFTGSTSLAVLDVSGRSNHGVLVGDRNTTWVADDQKLSLNFNGVNAYVNSILSATFNLAIDSITFSFWNRNPTGTTGVYAAISNSTNGTPFIIFQALGSAITLTHRSNASGDSATVGGVWQSAVWRMITGVSTPSTLSLFVNGLRVATTTRTAAATNLNQVNLGALNRAGTVNNYALSFLDDCRFYNRALTAQEIWQIYSQDRGGNMLHQPPKKQSCFAQAQTFKNYWFRNQQHMIGGGIR